MVHTEVVLKGDGSKGLSSRFHLYMLFGFYSLMESVTPSSSLHDTSCLLIHNLHLTVDYHIFVIFVEHGISLEELLQGMYTLALYGIVIKHRILLF